MDTSVTVVRWVPVADGPAPFRTSTGMIDVVVVPFPSWPEKFVPQQYTVFAVLTAQVPKDCVPVDTSVIVDRYVPVAEGPAPFTTSTGTLDVVLVPLPSWPELLWPQQYTYFVVLTAQVVFCPSDTWAIVDKYVPVDEGPAPFRTSAGAVSFVTVPLPSWPYVFVPQQYARCVEVTPQMVW